MINIVKDKSSYRKTIIESRELWIIWRVQQNESCTICSMSLVISLYLISKLITITVLPGLLTKDHKDMFYPFISSIKRQRKVMAIPVDEDILTTVLELVCPADNCIHKVWITNLVSGLLNACQLSFLCAVCNLKVS